MSSLFEDVMKKIEKKPKEIFETVVETILDELTVRSKRDNIPLDFKHPKVEDVDPYVINNILEKLQYDFDVIKKFDSPPSLSYVSTPPEPTPENPEIYNTFYVEVNEKFENWANNLLYTEQAENTAKKSTKYSRKALEKIWNVLQEIEEKRQLSASNKIGLVQYSFHKADITETEIIEEDRQNKKEILEKLVALKALEDLHPVKKSSVLYWYFLITDKFDEVFKYYEDEYQETARLYETNKANRVAKTEYVCEIIYTPNKEILLDGKYLLSKPDFNTENEAVFSYIFNNQNKRLTIEEIEKKTGKKLNKTLPNILDKLNFRGDLKKAFFVGVSKDAVEFRNPVTKEVLKKIGIERIRL